MAKRRRRKKSGCATLLAFPFELLRGILTILTPKKRRAKTRRKAKRRPAAPSRQRVAQSKAAIDEWLRTWPMKQSKRSGHPLEYWQGIARDLLAQRRKMDNNPITPIGHYAFKWPGATEAILDRNNSGMALEKAGKIDEAIRVYELSVADAFFGSHPYDRLRIIYTRQKQYQDAIRVCSAYIALPARKHGQNKDRFRHHRDKLKEKAKKARQK